MELLREEVRTLEELCEGKKGEGEDLYSDMRDKLSAQEDRIQDSVD